MNKRKPNRLEFYDYSQNGAYFITVCTRDKVHLFGEIVGGGVLDAPQMQLSKYGVVVDNQIKEINDTYTYLNIDKYVIMPNHVHFMISICNDYDKGMSRTPSPTNAVVPRVVSTFKRFTNKKCGTKLWQRSFHDHVIRNETDYQRICQYIDTDPIKWKLDCYYIE